MAVNLIATTNMSTSSVVESLSQKVEMYEKVIRIVMN